MAILTGSPARLSRDAAVEILRGAAGASTAAAGLQRELVLQNASAVPPPGENPGELDGVEAGRFAASAG
jgi:hypothetical protein